MTRWRNLLKIPMKETVEQKGAGWGRGRALELVSDLMKPWAVEAGRSCRRQGREDSCGSETLTELQ